MKQDLGNDVDSVRTLEQPNGVDDVTVEVEGLPDVQLLVIDLGDCCVVKVERCDSPLWLSSPKIAVGDKLETGRTMIYREPFADIREAIEALARPRHYIENRSNDEFPDYWLIWHCPPASAGCMPTCGQVHLGGTGAMGGLAALAGHPLPVYEGSGKWTRLTGYDWTRAKQQAAEAGYSVGVHSYERALMPFDAWRYTR